MGQPKLLMDLAGQTVLSRFLDAMSHPQLETRAIVIRKDDYALLQHVGQFENLLVVTPDVDPPDMRASVQAALQEIRQRFAPKPNDYWVLSPADHPLLDNEILKKLWKTCLEEQPFILVPTFQQKRGHPAFFRWSLMYEVFSLPADRGLNQLIRDHAESVLEIPCQKPGILFDLDTPEDFERISRQFESTNQ
ncbi:MAG: nucleotidyltransferase family protein [Planctomycetaceae bacterium]